MRIILWLAAGMAAMAIGSAGAARSGGAAPGAGPPSWSGGGGRAVKGDHTRFAIGPIKTERPGRHHGRWGRRGFYPYAGAGIAGPVGEVDPYGNGFFNRGGGQIQLRGGRPFFDYDRGYPYEWGSSARDRPQRDEEPLAAEPPRRCTMENGVRVCRGW